MKKFAPFALLTAALFAVSSTAVAGPPPIREDLVPQEATAAQSCTDFGLRVEGTDAKARVKTFKNGKQIISGKGYLLTYTNLVSGESITFETQGTAEITSAPVNNVVTVTATGSNGLILFDTDASEVDGVETPSAIQYTGRIVYTINLKTGVFTLISASGQQRDLCVELA
jgi:hypothetical protein